jgi:hypothetical protein
MQNTRSVYLPLKQIEKINYISIQVCQLIDCSKNVVAVFLPAPTRTLPHFVLSCFLFRGMVRNGIPRVCFHFSFTERNSELFSLPLKGLEGNSESLLLFLCHGTEFRVVFHSAEGSGSEFREFASIFCPRNGTPS